jgi:glycosyltransferase involved in cell wall biosynthesis
MIESVHSASWINQIGESELFEIFIFPSKPTYKPHLDLGKFKVKIPLNNYFSILSILGLKSFMSQSYYGTFYLINRFLPNFFQNQLKRYVNKVKPDLVHTLETQGAGYLFSALRKTSLEIQNLKWWHTNWGSDIQIFSKMKSHQGLIRGVLSQANYYSCECSRDVQLAHDWGFNGEVLPVYPNTGGFKMEEIDQLRASAENTSNRKYIMLKGYNGWAGRALVAIRSLGRCADILKGYKIVLFSVHNNALDVQIAVDLLINSSGLEIEILPSNLTHTNILQYHGMARISIGLSVGDGISTSLLEAMAMGSFPIQSSTSCVNEWVIDGETGLIVPPEDPEIIEKAIRRAISDNEMVDSANHKNYKTIQEKAEYSKLKILTNNSYNRILK